MGQDCQPCHTSQRQNFDFPAISSLQILQEYQNFKKINQKFELKAQTLEDGLYFIGTLDENKKKHGYGQIRKGDFLYAGYFKDDLPHGEGILITDKNEYYCGQFNNGLMEGNGKQLKQHFSFKGQYKEGKRIKGQLIHPKYIYNGQFENNLFHGNGTIKYLISQSESQQKKDQNHHIQYSGGFEHGKFHGKGKLSFKQNENYQGAFQNGLYNGYGVYKYSNGNQYHGLYQKGKKHGYGRLYLGQIQFAGQWKDGQRNGKAIISKSKEAVFGRWEKNQLIENH